MRKTRSDCDTQGSKLLATQCIGNLGGIDDFASFNVGMDTIPNLV